MKGTEEHNKKGKTQQGDINVEDKADNSKNRGHSRGRYTLGGYSRDSKSGGHNRELYT
jgi:hypothetical protein